MSARDLGGAAATGVLEADTLDDSAGQRRRPSCSPSLTRLSRWLEVLAEEALQLGDRDQPLPHGAFTVCAEGTTPHSIVEMLTPSALAACLRLYAMRSGSSTSCSSSGGAQNPLRLRPSLA